MGNKYSCNFWVGKEQIDRDDMEYMVRKLEEEYKKWGLAINLEKTKYVWEKEK